MAAHYLELLETLRKAFPQPVSDPVHDGYVVFSILRALDKVDALKSQAPILGTPTEPDYARAIAERVDLEGRPLETVMAELVRYLEGMFIWAHPRSQINVVPTPSIASIIGVLLPLMYNPNLCSDESARLFSEAELRAIAMTASLVGYDPARAGGVFTFGGTGTMLYGVKIGLEKAIIGAGHTGVREPAVILASDQSHYSCLNVANWLGLGQDNVVTVPTHLDNSMIVEELESRARQVLASGRKIAAIVATMGTTDAFGIDDLRAIDAVRRRLAAEFQMAELPHLHADAVIGWAWSVFDDYDLTVNALGFRGRTIRAIAAARRHIEHLRLADSIGIDFHKTGYTPYTSSLVLVRDRTEFGRITRTRETMPYLYQSGKHHPGMYTLETTRSAAGPMAALANLMLLGKEGYQALLGHAVEMAEVLREMVESHPNLTVLNGDNVGPVTLFRAYPDDVDTFTVKPRERSDASYASEVVKHNEYNRKIFERVHHEALAGRGVVISLTNCYRHTDSGMPIVALKSYVLSPFADEHRMQSVVSHVLEARKAADEELRGG